MTQPAYEERSERRVSSVAIPHPAGRRLSLLSLAALGVVYGDIGTSPLYAFRACFSADLGLPRSPANVYGVLSLIVWSLILIVTVKYVVASQALISGAFSLTHQCVQLRYCPRLSIVHTSRAQAGQIYIPAVNAALMVGCLLLVLGFRSSTALGAAYGIAVTGTMAITTVLFAVLARRLWRWSLWRTAAVAGVFLVVDLAFATANLAKIRQGGWVPRPSPRISSCS
jgi:K+ transporter